MSAARAGALPANPRLERLEEYPFARLEEVRTRIAARGLVPIDLSLGDPREPTPAGGLATPLALTAERGYLPDLDAVPAATWRETALLWLNYPHNPTGAVATRSLYDRALALAATHGFVVASDEAYAEVWFDEPPPSLLQSGTARALAFHTLSKRSAMTGYRSGFFAGDPTLVAAYRRLRPSLGVAMPDFVQAMSIAAWSDDAHAETIRRTFAARRDILAPALGRLGLAVTASQATFFLWARAPGGDDVALAERWFEAGVLVLPGSWLGAAGRGYVRIALVPTLEECREAVARLEAAR